MKIRSIAHAVPSRLVTNEELIDRIVSSSRRNLSRHALVVLRKSLIAMFGKLGARTRYHRAQGERALDFGVEAAQTALQQAGLRPEQIDLLLYVGVGRGFLEPATGNVFQDALKLSHATCFDILDACASWLWGLDVACHMLRGGDYQNAMILNCEFNVQEYGTPVLESLESLYHLGAGFTIGEAATATIVSRSSDENGYHASFRNFGARSQLCQIPLPNSHQFSSNESNGERRPLQFYANAVALNGRVIHELEQHYWNENLICGQDHQIIFGHSVGLPTTRRVLKKLRLDPEKFYEVFPQYGNTVSASLPLAMSLALEEDRLRRGQRTLLIVGSAGVTTALCSLTF